MLPTFRKVFEAISNNKMSSESFSSFNPHPLRNSVDFDPKKPFNAGFTDIKLKIVAAVKATHPTVGRTIEAGVIFTVPTVPVKSEVKKVDEEGEPLSEQRLMKAESSSSQLFELRMKEFTHYGAATQMLHSFLSKAFVDKLHVTSETALKAFVAENPMVYWREICALAEGGLGGCKLDHLCNLVRSLADLLNFPDGHNTIDEGRRVEVTVNQCLRRASEIYDNKPLLAKLGAYVAFKNLNPEEFSKTHDMLAASTITDAGLTSFPADIGALMVIAEGMKTVKSQKVNLAQTGPLANKTTEESKLFGGKGPCTKCNPEKDGRLSHPTDKHVDRQSHKKNPRTDAEGDTRRDLKRNGNKRNHSVQETNGGAGGTTNGEKFQRVVHHLTIRRDALSGEDLNTGYKVGSVKGGLQDPKEDSLDTGTQVLVTTDKSMLKNCQHKTLSLLTIAGPVDMHTVGEHRMFGGQAALGEKASVGLANFCHISKNYDFKGCHTDCREIDRATGRPMVTVTAFTFALRKRDCYPEDEPSTEITYRAQKEGEHKSLFLLEKPARLPAVTGSVKKRQAPEAGSDSEESGSEEEHSWASSEEDE